MKDYPRKNLIEAYETNPTFFETPKDPVKFCLNRLFQDKQHSIFDEVTDGLTFEELIGTLLSVQDYMTNQKEEFTDKK